jgi:LemA protein
MRARPVVGIVGNWSQIQREFLGGCADLFPNLVVTVQGYATQERHVLITVADARAKSRQIKLQQFQDTQNQLSNT